MIWVTHEVQEALGYSDKIMAINFGKIQQFAGPKDVFFKPSNLFVANFISENNLIVGNFKDNNFT